MSSEAYKKKYYKSTIKGRVVYDRKKHYFSLRDLLRISKALDDNPNLPTGIELVNEYRELVESLDAFFISRLTVTPFKPGRPGAEYFSSSMMAGLQVYLSVLKKLLPPVVWDIIMIFVGCAQNEIAIAEENGVDFIDIVTLWPKVTVCTVVNVFLYVINNFGDLISQEKAMPGGKNAKIIFR